MNSSTTLLRGRLLMHFDREPGYGYDAHKQMRALGFPLDRGGLYRALHRMEQDGLLTSEPAPSELGPDRRLYRVTDRGREHLAELVVDATRHAVTLDRFVQDYRA